MLLLAVCAFLPFFFTIFLLLRRISIGDRRSSFESILVAAGVGLLFYIEAVVTFVSLSFPSTTVDRR